MRHGKSAYPPGVRDHERPLATRGQREAGLAGAWLRDTQPEIDAVLCSTATRTRQTLAATGIQAPTEYESRIYEASPPDLIDLVRATDETASTLLVVGHAPTMPWTALTLARNRTSEPAAELSTKFPTSALAVLEFDGGWADVEAEAGELVDFHVPR